MIAADLPFTSIVLEDFEYISRPGERPDVVCAVFHELRTGQTTRLWRGELGAQPPYDIGPDTLVVSFVFNAEASCHLSLGWTLPRNVLDLSAEFKRQVNGKGILRKNQGLIGALQHFGLSSIAPKRKDAMRERIMRGWPFTAEEREQIVHYCSQDVEALRQLLHALLPGTNLPLALHHGEAVAALALMEHRGVPIDGPIFSELADKTTWREIRDSLVPLVDVHGIYIHDKNGWHFNTKRFERWTVSEGMQWPRNEETSKLDLRRKTFESMAKSYAAVEPLRQLRYIRDKLRTIQLSVRRDGRNRTTLWPFSSKTSRTQPKAKHWIFSPSVWLRFLIRPEPGKPIAYIDYSSMEFLVAAALSDGRTGTSNPMLELYNSGDPYTGFGKIIGYLSPDAKRGDPGVEAIRNRLKVLCLATQYGMQEKTLATRLGVSEIEAREMLLHHRGLFSQYWHWSEDWLHHSLDSGLMQTVLGWQCVTGISEFNERSIRNFPVQATSADIFRLACVWATRHGITMVAPVHDAVLIESTDDRIEADVALMQEIMRRASRVILNPTAAGTIELRTDAKIIRHPDRYTDSRGVELWNTVRKMLDDRRAGAAAFAREAGHG